MNKISIKAKITIWYTLIILLVSFFALFIMISVSRDILIKDSAEKLTSAVERIIPMLESPQSATKPRAPKEEFKKLPEFMFFDNGVHTAVYDSEKNAIGGALPFEFADDIELSDGELLERSFDGSEYLTYCKKFASPDGDVLWATGVISIADEGLLLKSVSKTNIILITMLTVVASVGGYLILKQAFKPVEKISSTARSISESRDLSQRIALGNGNDEIHSLANTFDDMLEKIETTLNNEKQFTSDASHELRTPVAVISSECEYALDCATSTEEIKESVLSIKEQADKMSKMISELLAISRIDQNSTAVNSESCNISELLGFICDEQSEIQKKGITLKRSITPNIFALTDPMLLARVFVNLISNAYTYGKENGSIEVYLYEKENNIIFKVIDDGIGIDQKDLPKIWERFYQVNESRTNKDGNIGLGLSMVKLIADKLNLKLRVESTLGVGSAFTVIIEN